MSNNTRTKNKMIKYYGKICMVEEAGIRKIPKEIRMKIKGYKKFDDTITFHHLIPKREGGRATQENGALVKDYNHRWLESLPSIEREKVNNKIREFKISFSELHIKEKGLEINSSKVLEFNSENINENDTITIPVFDTRKEDINKKKKIKSRTKLKKELQQEINDTLYCDEDLEI